MSKIAHQSINLLFDNWESIARKALLPLGAYFLMVGLLRISGKRTLAKMNAFDFVVTVSAGFGTGYNCPQ